jgi:hypothetical protein
MNERAVLEWFPRILLKKLSESKKVSEHDIMDETEMTETNSLLYK